MKKILKLSFIMFFFSTLMLAQERGSSLWETIDCEEITLTCRQCKAGEYIIKNNAEYRKLLRQRSPHPAIDFNQYTLIGYLSLVAGCSMPKIYHEVKQKGNSYMVNVTVIQQGLCQMGNPI